MSASEKLKSPDFDYRDDLDVVSWAALVAVVEAAEKEAPFEERGGNTGDLRAALAALDEALS